ncbi:MAG: phosphotransferase [Pseudomonadota bacterium]
MSRHPFYDLSETEQIAALGRLARTALKDYGLEDAELRPVAYRENMTFSVDAGARGRFALRVHQAGYRTDAEIQSELDFIEHINASGVRTPRLLRPNSDASFVHAAHKDVDVVRQCDMFEWIDGRPFRRVGAPMEMSVDEATSVYAEVGRQVASIYNATENWQRPKGFDRRAWDAEGIFGVTGQLGDFRKIEGASVSQRKLLNDISAKVEHELDAFGKAPDRYGLTQADLMPENIMICQDGIRLIDFDDTGDSWVLFEVVTALIDLVGSDYFDPCLGAIIAGFREHRALPDEHLGMIPTFMMARILSYVAHTVSHPHLEQSDQGLRMMMGMIEEHGPAYLKA